MYTIAFFLLHGCRLPSVSRNGVKLWRWRGRQLAGNGVEWFPGICSVNACGVQEQIRVEKEKFAQARAAVEQELSTLSSQLQVAGVVQRLP
jgi:hypothetical protein